MANVNVAVILQTYYLKGLNISPAVWTILMLVAGTVFALWFTLRHQDMAYPLVFIWVLVKSSTMYTYLKGRN